MQNISDWKPSKIIRSGDTFRPNLKHIDPQSYYICNVYLEYYVKYIRENARGKMLDCGCGPVPYYEIYKDLVDEIICTDWQSSRHEHKHVDVFSDLNQGLALESGIFDTVLLTDVLEHIYSPGRLLSEIHRVLKKGGRAVIAVPFIYRIHEEPHDYFRYTEYALKRMCEEAGLRIIKLEPYGRYLDVLFDTLNKVFLRNRLLIKAVMPLTRILKRSFISRKINKAHQDKYALGYILSAEKI